MKIIEIGSPLDCPRRDSRSMFCWHEKQRGELRKCNEQEQETFPEWCPLEDKK